ncbi:hypothetical protein H2198_004717 [Neophaeococcomyces mojaviensis]|uniref:Uncharacterized protein n=1 Tax=Neophaeococcomyces mojaviensis TaxID=3383035 RepID=A0ACC3A8A4_9EURO|nr:hypothetical protein H2198_004717 [Knufia sp. JES_112]
MSAFYKSDLAQRIRAAFHGLAVCDALGAPLEFQQRRHDPNFYIRDMLPNTNFDLPAGHFTDDTSMALCLAFSLCQNNGQHDAVDQAGRYVMWLDEGYMSSLPKTAFDVGTQTRQALQYWRTKPSIETQEFVRKKFNEDWRCGNGSLMRVLPCALVANTEEEAVFLARESSRVTHPHSRCVEACALYSTLVFHALRGASKAELVQTLQQRINDTETDFTLAAMLKPYVSLAAFLSKPRDEISSSGYVIHSLEAALWAFFNTDSFEEGAIEVVNLGDDADTVGAIYGGLAGAFYGDPKCIPERWLNEMKSKQTIFGASSCMLEVHVQRQGDVQHCSC